MAAVATATAGGVPDRSTHPSLFFLLYNTYKSPPLLFEANGKMCDAYCIFACLRARARVKTFDRRRVASPRRP